MPTDVIQPYWQWRNEEDSGGQLRRFYDPPASFANFPVVTVETVIKPLVRVFAHEPMDRWSVWVPYIVAHDGATLLTIELRASIVEGYTSTIAFAPAPKGIPLFADDPLVALPSHGLNALVWTVWGSVDAGSATVALNLIGDRSKCCELGP